MSHILGNLHSNECSYGQMFLVVNDLEPYHAQNHVCVCLHVYAQATAWRSEESLIFGKCLCNAMPSNITCFPVEATVKDYVYKAI